MVNLDQARAYKKTYALNLKLAALRLGESLLICCKQQNSYFIGLVSINT